MKLIAFIGGGIAGATIATMILSCLYIGRQSDE